MIASLIFGTMLVADPAQIDCPLTSMSPAEHASFEAFVAERGSTDDPRFVMYKRAVEGCAARHHWSQEAAGTVTLLQVIVVGTARVRASLIARGLRIEGIEQAILGDAALMQELRGGEMNKSSENFVGRHGDLFDAFIRARPESERAAAQSDVQDFVAGTGLIQICRARFAEQ